MSDFRLQHPDLFLKLNQSLQMIDRTAPGILTRIKSHLEMSIKNIQIDIKETENEIKELKNKQREMQQASSNTNSHNPSNNSGSGSGLGNSSGKSLNDLKSEEIQKSQKLEELKNALSTLGHLKIRFVSKETQLTKKISDSKDGQQKLKAFHDFAVKYMAFPKNGGNYVYNDTSQTGNSRDFSVFKGVKKIGDTFHYSNDGGLSQYKVDEIERNIKNSSEKGNKISINNISQSDFSVLEKNGYTIQKIDANEFSAYKNIEK